MAESYTVSSDQKYECMKDCILTGSGLALHDHRFVADTNGYEWTAVEVGSSSKQTESVLIAFESAHFRTSESAICYMAIRSTH